jgi:hypothetical protein
MTLAAATVAEGVLGLEGIHSANGFDLEGRGSTMPRARLRAITGLHSKELEDSAMANTGRMGETSLPSLMRGKTVTYSGELEARTLPELRVLENSMRGAFQQDTVLTFTVAPPPARGGVSHSYTGRVLQLTLDDELRFGPTRIPSPHARAFVLAVKQYDPRYYVTTATSDTESAGVATVLTNEGNAPTEPSFTVIGGASLDQADIRNQTTGKKLLFTGLLGLVPAGQSMVVDFANREVYNSVTGADLSGRMDVTLSDWWDEGTPGVVPGANSLIVLGTGTTSYTVTFKSANW